MRLNTTTDPAAITALVEPLLAAEPVRNTVFSSVIAGLASPDADGWCTHPERDPSVLAVRSQRHTPVVVTAGWDEFGPLADAVAAQRPVTALGGPVPVVEALAAALDARGLPATSRVDERLFRLDDLTEPPAPAGTARVATLEDRELLVEWFGAFELEAFGAVRPGVDPATVIERALHRSRFWLWTDAGGSACAMAARHPVAFGVARIGPVYTPPGLRGRGYGSAVTAEATRDVRRDAAVPVLYTDLANATSNKIYLQLGYYPVEDRAHVGFS
jgi:predicted GNAT family acetyltransferase